MNKSASDDYSKRIVANTISNYVSIGLRMILGLFLFRMLYQGMAKEEFGYWSLLWSVFGYGIILDFGFGFTAVKKVAELSVTEDWDQLSKVLSTIFYLYLLIGLGIILFIFAFSHQLIHFFAITNNNQEYFRQVLVVFFVGMGLSFPLGIFPEILIGQQRIWLVNLLFSLGTIANFVLVAAAVHYQWGLKSLVAIALVCGVFPSVISALMALKKLPHVSMHPRHFSRKMIGATMSFSIFAYISTVSNIILVKTDQLVISTTLAVSAIALYQAGSKVAEMFMTFSHQLPETFSPAAAHLHAKGEKDYLRGLLIQGTRYSVMIATPVYIVCTFFMEGMLSLLTGDKDLPKETIWIGQVLLTWGYMLLVTQAVTKRIFMMTGHEKRLMWLGVGEAVLNLALSVCLVHYFKNVVCVAIGSLLATMVFGWGFIWPWAAKEANLSPWALAKNVLFPIWFGCIPLLAFIAFLKLFPLFDYHSSFVKLIIECLLATVLGCIGLWRLGLTHQERQSLALKLGSIFSKGKAA